MVAERKKRGLGRGLGALINSDGENNGGVSGAAVHAVPALEPEIQPEPLDTSEVPRTNGAPERPIDVFFSAKSHLETQRVSRETPSESPRRSQSSPRNLTTPRRKQGTKRAEMPDVLGTHPPASSIDHGVAEPEPVVVSRETEPDTTAEAIFMDVSVERIRPNPRQPREVFDEEDMAELIHSVREVGVLQPIVVRPVEDGHFELIMGERRWRASQSAGKETIPAVVRQTADEDLLRDALLENIHRSELNPLEEAAAYRQLLDDFNISQEELSRRIGRSRPQISNTLRLMRLPAGVQRRVAAGVLSSGHARALLSLEDDDHMEELAQRIVSEGLSVRSAEEEALLVKGRRERGDVSRETHRLPTATRVQELDEYAEALTDRLDTQVKISLGAKKGRIAIDFASLDDLERILQHMGAYVQR
ncbi:ParB/RepB/Spo0J family partition protein [Nesterenkonia haasae]|uniref:ParB/RepB/Spo0J family partition protein n=1 Tax=Nesterenkonia haasae TaxID=2587813 RepID=UPI001391236E|nr:ParB/RepB/Spo0J family partition protein [Nesterenkonia haasae]NDK32016.1 ParB/RepB/Spo0J family partition protein [Nesterenkonia haasae]